MDDEKDCTSIEATEERKKPSTITEGVGNLVESVAHLVKETASVVADHIKNPVSVSKRVETAVPPVEENYDAPPMTADELAEHAAADNQPGETVPVVTPMGIEAIGTPDPPPSKPKPKKPRAGRKARSRTTSSRLTSILGNAAAKKKTKKAAAKKVAKKAAKKSKKKTVPKTGVKKGKPNKTLKAKKATASRTTSRTPGKKKKASKK